MTAKQFTVRVLGIHEDDEWCAIALEMSLRGYGETFETALEDLHEAIEAQVSFALEHDTLDAIWVPAEPHYVQLYDQARRRSLRRYLENANNVGDEEYAASDLTLPRGGTGNGRFEAVA